MIDTLVQSGVSVFAFDFHSQGFSSGDRSQLTLSVACQNFVDAFETLASHIKLDEYNIGLLGSSFGGTVVLQNHHVIPNLRAIALKSPASFLAESSENEHGFPDGMDQWRSDGISRVIGLSYSSYIDAIKHNTYASALTIHVPLLVVHGTADTTVPIRQSRRLCHLIGKSARLLELPGVNHDYKQSGAQESLESAMLSFFVKHLLE
jgi:dipeptidyl aminopeptidase/acylaminoacyl peptidase